MYSYLNHEIIDEKQAFLHVRDLAIQRGYGVFDFLKVKDGHPFFLDDYLDRFYGSSAMMHLPLSLERTELKHVIHQLIAKNNLRDSGIKMILTGGYSEDGYQPSNPNLIITQHSLSLPPPELTQKGVKIITYEYIRDLPTAKTINYSMGIWLINKVREQQAYDVLYYQNNIVSEFPRCNLFVVRQDNTVATPADQVLRGITRKNVLKLAAKNHKTEEGVITLDDLYGAKEVFLTSTTKRILPIVQINDTKINDGKPGHISQALLRDLINLEREDMLAGN